jgi:two-component system CheB/CheR fusion protein
LEICSQSRFDLLLCDIQLPDRDGNWLMRELSSRYPIKGIALSGLAMPDDIQDGRAAGFMDYVTKPVSLDELLMRIRAALEPLPRDVLSSDETLNRQAI